MPQCYDDWLTFQLHPKWWWFQCKIQRGNGAEDIAQRQAEGLVSRQWVCLSAFPLPYPSPFPSLHFFLTPLCWKIYVEKKYSWPDLGKLVSLGLLIQQLRGWSHNSDPRLLGDELKHLAWLVIDLSWKCWYGWLITPILTQNGYVFMVTFLLGCLLVNLAPIPTKQ